MIGHAPVLLHACINGLNINTQGIYVDATYGGGGHSRAILDQLGVNGKLIAFDTDLAAKDRLINDPRFFFINENFRYIKRFLKLNKINKVDGILADLGVSSFQLDSKTRGFSNRFDAPLDMRMNNARSKTAADIVNNYSATELQLLFQNYGEIRNSQTLAKCISNASSISKIETTGQLLEIIDPVVRGKKPKYLAQVFQSLRIEVNQEMAALEEFLEQTEEVLKPGGRLVMLSFHSLEDRIVKNYIKTGNVTGEPERDEFGRYEVPLKTINKKVIVASEEEIKENKRSRSAKLRIAERKYGENSI